MCVCGHWVHCLVSLGNGCCDSVIVVTEYEVVSVGTTEGSMSGPFVARASMEYPRHSRA